MARSIIVCLAFAVVTVLLLLVVNAAAQANDDFSIRLSVNGDDISEMETIVVDPEQELTIDLQIFNVTRDVILRRVSLAVTFAGQVVLTQSETLDNFRIAAGEDYRQEITINAREVLKIGNLPLVTGIYRSQIKLEYAVGGQEKVLSQWKNIRILGNPLSTPLGAAGIVMSAGALAFILMLVRALAAPGLPAGITLPVNASVSALPLLYELASERLEPLARGRVTGSIVNATKRRIVKDSCPICETRLKHGYCYTCKKSAREVRGEYRNKLKNLTLQGGQLIASGQAVTLDNLCSSLGISAKLGTDVIATLKHAKLIKVKGMARKLMGKAVAAGLSSGLSTVIWVTVGGFVVLSALALVAILLASIVIPVAVTRGLQMRARRAIRRGTK